METAVKSSLEKTICVCDQAKQLTKKFKNFAKGDISKKRETMTFLNNFDKSQNTNNH